MSEQIVTGKKYRILTDVAQKIWQRVSFWTKSSDVEFNDGKTAETKVGAIDGITDSLVSTSSNIAASAKAVSELNGNIDKLSGGIEYKILDSVTGTSPITITGEYNELLIICEYNNYAYNFVIPVIYLSDTEKIFSIGNYLTGTNSGFVQVVTTSHNIRILHFYTQVDPAIDRAKNAKITIYTK